MKTETAISFQLK